MMKRTMAISPESELEKLTQELDRARRQFTDVVMSIQEGVVIFDRDRRLVLCNDTYRQFYVDAVGQKIADMVVPGAYQLDFLAAAFEAGMFPDIKGTTEQYIEQRRRRQKELRRAVEIHFSSGVWVQVNERPTHDGGFVAVYTDITELKRRGSELENLSNRLAKYLSPQVYNSIFSGRQEVRVVSQRKKLTIFFSDIENFTETTEFLESEDLTGLLNHYLTEMSKIALEAGATIDKYIGDAMMMFFGDPESRGLRHDALACVRMAVAMQQRMHELQKEWLDRGLEHPFRMRIGINTGYCTVGNFGSDERMDYTIIGNAVNLASRLQAHAEPGGILLAHETYALINNEIPCKRYESIRLKGVSNPVRTYRVPIPKMPIPPPEELITKRVKADLAHLDQTTVLQVLDEIRKEIEYPKSKNRPDNQ